MLPYFFIKPRKERFLHFKLYLLVRLSGLFFIYENIHFNYDLKTC